MQAQTIARMARELGTNIIAHGCTAAGNDQVRFEVALRTLAPELEVLAPVRDKAFKRQEELEYLQKRNLPVPPLRCRVLHQSRAVGRDDRRQGDAHLRRQHSRRRLGAVDAMPSRIRASRNGTSIAFERGRAVRARRQGALARAGHRDSSKRWPRRSASAAAFIWATPSSAPRAASRSKRRRRKRCSDRASRAREAGAHRRASSASRNCSRSPTATSCTKASCWIRCAATSKRCCCPRRSA